MVVGRYYKNIRILTAMAAALVPFIWLGWGLTIIGIIALIAGSEPYMNIPLVIMILSFLVAIPLKAVAKYLYEHRAWRQEAYEHDIATAARKGRYAFAEARPLLLFLRGRKRMEAIRSQEVLATALMDHSNAPLDRTLDMAMPEFDDSPDWLVGPLGLILTAISLALLWDEHATNAEGRKLRRLIVNPENAMVEAFSAHCNIIAVGRDLALGPVLKLDTGDAHWKNNVVELSRRAMAIFLVVDKSPAVVWEVEHVLASEALREKTFLLIPSGIDAQSWPSITSALPWIEPVWNRSQETGLVFAAARVDGQPLAASYREFFQRMELLAQRSRDQPISLAAIREAVSKPLPPADSTAVSSGTLRGSREN